jgi:hypothetical protein
MEIYWAIPPLVVDVRGIDSVTLMGTRRARGLSAGCVMRSEELNRGGIGRQHPIRGIEA